MRRRRPRSTLFPYTTLFRSEFWFTPKRRSFSIEQLALRLLERRSEEHTSELQSHSDLVCRLLLEKKNLTRSTATTLRFGVSRSERTHRIHTRCPLGGKSASS